MVLWMARSLVALGFMLLYERHYAALDAYSYYQTVYEQGSLGTSQFWVNASGIGTQSIHVLVWVHQRLLVLESYHALKLSFAMIGLVAVYLFYQAAVIFLRQDRVVVLYVLGLFPSIIFWSSIIGKDPVVLLGVALYSNGVVRWCRKPQYGALVVLCAGIIIATIVRPWMGFLLIAPLVVLLNVVRHTPQSKVMIALAATVALVIAATLFRKFVGIGTVQDFLEYVNSLKESMVLGGSAWGSDIEFTTVGDLIRFLPVGIFTAMFRPLIGEVTNIFGVLAGLENMVLLVLVVVATSRAQWRDLRHPVIVWALLLITMWAVIYAFVSSFNLGAAVRFRLQVMPLVVCLLMYFLYRVSPPAAANAPSRSYDTGPG